MENTKNNSKLWFKAKRYGWGWTPSAWQGWMVLLVYLVSVLGIAFCLKLPIHFGFNSVYIFSPSIFILISNDI